MELNVVLLYLWGDQDQYNICKINRLCWSYKEIKLLLSINYYLYGKVLWQTHTGWYTTHTIEYSSYQCGIGGATSTKNAIQSGVRLKGKSEGPLKGCKHLFNHSSNFVFNFCNILGGFVASNSASKPWFTGCIWLSSLWLSLFPKVTIRMSELVPKFCPSLFL